MSNWTITFQEPLPWLLLLGLIPALWWFSLKSLSGLGPIRRYVALGLRTVCVLLIILALAGAQKQLRTDRITVIYLLDQSESIPVAMRQSMVDLVVQEVQAHRDTSRRDRAAVIVFGRNANIEVAPLEASELPIYGQLESVADLRVDATNLAAAMKLAQGIFPEDSARRLVIVSDGNENLGDARSVASLLAEDGVGIDVIPVPIGDQGEVAVESVVLPSDVRRGQPFETRVVLENLAPPGGPGQTVSGKVVLLRRRGQDEETLAEQAVELPVGKRVLSFTNTIEQPDFYEYEARFVPDDAAADTLVQNNRATAFTQVLAEGHILLIEDWEHPGEFDYLVDHLRNQDLQVTVERSNQLFSSLGELQRYDCIILANVPRSSGGTADNVTNFSDEQIAMLVRNTKEMGCGLIMLGGPQSFGVGGWASTELEKAMPVDFQIRNAKVVPIGALAMVMHASEIPQGNYWQKVIADEAIKILGPNDYCGVVHWSGKEEWLWNRPHGMAKVGPNRAVMRARLGRMTPGDMPDFDPSLRLAAAAFSRLTDAAIKHMIVISDGDPQPASNAVLNQFKQIGAQITTVAVGAHGPAGHAELQRIARITGGKYYVVNNPQALPRIYQRETRRIARPLIKETVVQPIVTLQHEILEGIAGPPPPIRGFVLTSVKQNPLVQVLMVSPEPAEVENATLLACWQYDLGRTAVLTTDAGYRWADQWTSWPDYDKLFSQLVRWAMRPTGDTGNFDVATHVRDGRVEVVVTAMDTEDQLLNFLQMSATAVGPDMQAHAVQLEQVAPGRYVGNFEASTAGSYFLTLSPGVERTVLRRGINVPYSSEYRDREINTALLDNLARLVPADGSSGQVTPPLRPGNLRQLIEQQNSFRRSLAPAVSIRDIWPLLALACATVFFADVFVRRVSVSWEWLQPAYRRVLVWLGRGTQGQDHHDERLERLRGRKQAVEQALDRQRAAVRFEPSTTDAQDVREALAQPEGRPAAPRADRESLTGQGPQEDDYTARLLKAKRQAQARKKGPPGAPQPPAERPGEPPGGEAP